MPGKILIVDDSISMRQMIRFALEENQWEVLEAPNGKAAVEQLRSDLQCIITDLYMPEMDGITFIKTVRQSMTNKFTPIIMLTTESEPQKQEAGKQAGATAWIVKPFTPEKLLQTITAVLGK